MSQGPKQSKQDLPPRKSIEEKLTEWVNNEGYPLEFFTAHAFRSAEFEVIQGSYARDIKTEKFREIDVSAHRAKLLKGNILVDVKYIVECKWSGTNPWIVFTTPKPWMKGVLVANNTIGTALGSALLRSMAPILSVPQFNHRGNIGFGGRRAFIDESPRGRQKDSRDHFFDAISAVVGAAVSECVSSDAESLPVFQRPLPAANVSICFPLIVVDAPLFEGSYDDKTARIQVSAKEWCRVGWSGSEHKGSLAFVDIVSKDALVKYIQWHELGVDDLLNHIIGGVESFFRLRETNDHKSMLELLNFRSFEELPEWIQKVWHHHIITTPDGPVGSHSP